MESQLSFYFTVFCVCSPYIFPFSYVALMFRHVLMHMLNQTARMAHCTKLRCCLIPIKLIAWTNSFPTPITSKRVEMVTFKQPFCRTNTNANLRFTNLFSSLGMIGCNGMTSWSRINGVLPSDCRLALFTLTIIILWHWCHNGPMVTVVLPNGDCRLNVYMYIYSEATGSWTGLSRIKTLKSNFFLVLFKWSLKAFSLIAVKLRSYVWVDIVAQ